MFHLYNIAVFFPECPVPYQSCAAKVEELGEGTGFGGVIVDETRPVELSEDGGELFEKNTLEVGVLLV